MNCLPKLICVSLLAIITYFDWRSNTIESENRSKLIWTNMVTQNVTQSIIYVQYRKDSCYSVIDDTWPIDINLPCPYYNETHRNSNFFDQLVNPVILWVKKNDEKLTNILPPTYCDLGPKCLAYNIDKSKCIITTIHQKCEIELNLYYWITWAKFGFYTSESKWIQVGEYKQEHFHKESDAYRSDKIAYVKTAPNIYFLRNDCCSIDEPFPKPPLDQYFSKCQDCIKFFDS